jgi:chromosome segregation ATPase
MVVIIGAVLFLGGLVFFLGKKHDSVQRYENAQTENLGYELSTAIDEINSRLDSIRITRNVLFNDVGPSDVRSKKDNIFRNIQLLTQLINENENKLSLLNQKLLRATKDNNILRKKLFDYSESRQDIIRELEDLKYALELSEKENQQLITKLAEQNKKELRQQVKLNATENIAYTAYYIIGDQSQLKKWNVYNIKDGREFSLGEFEKVDMRAEAIIPTYSKKAKLLTVHRPGTYSWQEDDIGNKLLCILEPLNFWENTKHLIIEVK